MSEENTGEWGVMHWAGAIGAGVLGITLIPRLLGGLFGGGSDEQGEEQGGGLFSIGNMIMLAVAGIAGYFGGKMFGLWGNDEETPAGQSANEGGAPEGSAAVNTTISAASALAAINQQYENTNTAGANNPDEGYKASYAEAVASIGSIVTSEGTARSDQLRAILDGFGALTEEHTKDATADVLEVLSSRPNVTTVEDLNSALGVNAN